MKYKQHHIKEIEIFNQKIKSFIDQILNFLTLIINEFRNYDLNNLINKDHWIINKICKLAVSN